MQQLEAYLLLRCTAIYPASLLKGQPFNGCMQESAARYDRWLGLGDAGKAYLRVDEVCRLINNGSKYKA